MKNKILYIFTVLLVVIPTITRGVKSRFIDLQLLVNKEYGQHTVAKVLKCNETSFRIPKINETNNYYKVEYSYKSNSGNQVGKCYFETSIKEDTHVSIIYSPRNPKVSMIENGTAIPYGKTAYITSLLAILFLLFILLKQ